MPTLARRALLAAPLLLPGKARAQAWPTRPITWVVPFGAGGITDTSSRVAARTLSDLLGQPVVVENRPGAGGTIGAESVARAAPDGYTVLYGSQNTFAVAPAMNPALRYHPQRDFVPVHGIGAAPNLLVTGMVRPWADLRALVEQARRAPDALSYASTGIGTSSHLVAELLQSVAGIRMTHVPYGSPSQALADVIAGRLDMMFDFPLTAMPHVREGRLRALAVTTDDPLPIAPGIPSVEASGFPGVTMLAWAGLFAPARTPQAIVAVLDRAMAATLADPSVRAVFEGSGTILWHDMDAAALGRFLATELPRARDLVARAGIHPG